MPVLRVPGSQGQGSEGSWTDPTSNEHTICAQKGQGISRGISQNLTPLHPSVHLPFRSSLLTKMPFPGNLLPEPRTLFTIDASASWSVPGEFNGNTNISRPDSGIVCTLYERSDPSLRWWVKGPRTSFVVLRAPQPRRSANLVCRGNPHLGCTGSDDITSSGTTQAVESL